MSASPVILKTNYADLFGEDMLPVLEEIFQTEFARHPDRWPSLFQVRSTDRDIWQSSEIHDMPLFQTVAEGTDFPFERQKQGSSKTFVIIKHGLGFSISLEAMEDGKFDFIADGVRKLGSSASESREIETMNVVNNGFTTELTADGVSLFNIAHTLPSGGTYRNKLSADADLSTSSLEQMLTDYETQFVGDTGIIKNIRPRILLVHPSNKRLAKELVGSELKPDTATLGATGITNINNMNSFKEEGIVVMSSPHLTDLDAWFLISEPSENGLRVIQRSPVETIAAGSDAGFVNDSILYKSRYRWEVGAIHGYGSFGTTGA